MSLTLPANRKSPQFSGFDPCPGTKYAKVFRKPSAQASAAHTQRQAEAARRLAVETWLRRNGVIIITQNKKVLPIFLEKSAHNWLPAQCLLWKKRFDSNQKEKVTGENACPKAGYQC
jgi:hypothetical protein